MARTVIVASQPFVSSTAGAISLLLIGATAAFVFTYVPAKFKQTRDRDDKQLVLLTRLQMSISPADRKGLVERVETLERNLDVTTRELENHVALSQEQRHNLEAATENVKRQMENILDRIPGRRE